jgi:hypothetical membrane protein
MKAWAGLVAVVTGVQYLVLEAVAAAAWVDPRYRYTYNYISDLGVPGPRSDTGHRVIDSPLSAVMNTAFVVQGLGFLVVGLLLARHHPRRHLITAFAGAHAVGNVLVASFPSSTGSGLHVVGAVLAIAGGNAAAFTVGTAKGGPLRLVSAVLPVLGLVGILLLGRVGAGELDGLWERGGVYSITAWEIAFGVALLVTSRRRLGESRAL